MKRFLATIVILGSISGAAHAATMGSSSMARGMGMAMDCGAATCAASPAPSMPVQDCLEHCLASAQPFAVPGLPLGLTFALGLVALVTLAGRISTPVLAAKGAPPHLGPSLRTLGLAGVIMRN